MADNSPQRLAGRVFDLCVGTLLAAIALYGAVQIIKAIWIAICIGLLVIALIIGGAALIRSRINRW